MNEPIRLRLAAEHQALRAATAPLSPFALDHRFDGDPPTAHRFALQPFGWRVRRGDEAVAAYDPRQHGPAELVLVADPTVYPWQPWQATVLLAPGLQVVSPHVSGTPGAAGLCCWFQGPEFDPAAHPALAVLTQVLRILAGEVYELEGFALAEDMKVWFAAHRDELPFARVPEFGADRAPAAAPRGAGAIPRSALGIVFSTEAQR
ncbi:MAG: hypothetical protein AB7O97_20170 [Planctomycetota bacterium]